MKEAGKRRKEMKEPMDELKTAGSESLWMVGRWEVELRPSHPILLVLVLDLARDFDDEDEGENDDFEIVRFRLETNHTGIGNGDCLNFFCRV